VAKANGKASTWIPLSEALALVIAAYSSPQLAQRLLRKWIASKVVHWRHWVPGKQTPDIGAAAFWRPGSTVRRRRVVARMADVGDSPAADLGGRQVALPRVAWQQNRAERDGTVFYRIEIIFEEVIALLPPGFGPDTRSRKTAGKSWLAEEFAQNPPPPGMQVTDYARQVHERMRQAAATTPGLRVLKAKTIATRFHEEKKAAAKARPPK
jgi:hypothetical protein